MTLEGPSLTMKILTVNAHKGFTAFNRHFILHELREAVRATQADVVFLQEILGAHEGHAKKVARWPLMSQYEFLADSIWQDFAYGRNAAYPDGHHGNALLSKFPIVHYSNMDVSVGKHEKRGLLHCVLQLPGFNAQLHAVCVHLGLHQGQRNRQMNLLCGLVSTDVPAEAPLIVAGDFNDWGMRAQRILSGSMGMQEIFRVRQGRVARTFPARFPILCLDRIYVRNICQFDPIELSGRPWSHLSDHAPLAAEITI